MIRWKNALLIFLCLLLTAFSGCMQPGITQNPSGSTLAVVINEVVGKNSSLMPDEEGDYNDLIELYNPTGGQINLGGSYLTDSENNPQKWKMPNIYIPAHSYLVIFADGKDSSDPADGVYHTNFSISSKGETVYLVDSEGRIASSLQFPACDIADISYGRVQSGAEAGQAAWFAVPTPGQENSGNYAADFTNLQFSDIPLRINEYMTRNKAVLYDSDGDYSDWLELYNYGTETLTLSGMFLSDRADDPQKWKFPDGVTLAAGQYLVVFLSGKDKVSSTGELHASFALGSQDTLLLLSDSKGRQVDTVQIMALPENISRGRTPDAPDTWKLFTTPTPGKANTTVGYDDMNALTSATSKGLLISEACAAPADDNAYEWIEMHNASDKPVSLKGYGLSKTLSDPYAYTFPDITLDPGEYLLLYASNGVSVKNAASRSLPFSLSTSGNDLYLTNPAGLAEDAFSTGKTRVGVSAGRKTGSRDRGFFAHPTPGEENSASACTGYAQPPVLGNGGGYAKVGDRLSISVPAGATVRYTTDGSLPNGESKLYQEPILISESCVIRAAAFADGKLPSDTLSATFIIGVRHTLPVISLAGNPDDFFSYDRGIFADGPGYTETFPHQGANYWKDWEREVNFTYYDESGTRILSFGAGIRTFGQYSRAEAQKSVSLQIKDRYGNDGVYYPFFPDNTTTHFDALVLRMGGQDWKYSKIRDALVAQVIKNKLKVDYMDTRFVVVYLNGKYWGLYTLREKINENYFKNKYGQDPSTVNLIKGNSKVLAGSFDGYRDLLEYVKNHDLRVQENYDYVCGKVDIESLINWWICTTYFVNTDSGNIKFYTGADGKWRYIAYDFDWAMWKTTYNSENYGNYLERMLDPKGHGVGKNFSTVLMRGLIKNEQFKQKFIDMYSYAMKNVLNTDRVLGIINEMTAQIEEEIPRQAERWGEPSVRTFQNHVAIIKKVIEDKPGITVNNFMETFGLSRAEAESLFLP